MNDELIQLRTVAMLAQAVVDAHYGAINPDDRRVSVLSAIEDLDEALTRIGKPAESSGSEKDYREQSPEAGPEQAGSPS